jgi:hypothetical protein
LIRPVGGWCRLSSDHGIAQQTEINANNHADGEMTHTSFFGEFPNSESPAACESNTNSWLARVRITAPLSAKRNSSANGEEPEARRYSQQTRWCHNHPSPCDRRPSVAGT